MIFLIEYNRREGKPIGSGAATFIHQRERRTLVVKGAHNQRGDPPES